jgi:septum formation protein
MYRDKAGAYGVQDFGGALIRSINGDYYTVMGLPLYMLTNKLLNGDYFIK